MIIDDQQSGFGMHGAGQMVFGGSFQSIKFPRAILVTSEQSGL